MWEAQARAIEAQIHDGIAYGQTVLSMEYIGAKMAWPLRSAVSPDAFALVAHSSCFTARLEHALS